MPFSSSTKLFLNQWKDVLVTDFCHLLPSACNWIYHLKIKKDIQSYPLKDNTGKTAILYEHGGWTSATEEEPILILHGLYAHPLIMLHLSKLVKTIHKGPVFDFYISYDQIDPTRHRGLLTQAINSIEQMVKKKNSHLKGIIAIGHSMGAIEAAYKAFVEKDPRISSVISIAGPLKEIQLGAGSSRSRLQESLKTLGTAIQAHPNIPIYQIVGRHDWNASLDSTLVRRTPGSYYIIEDAMHFNILFKKELYKKLREYLQKPHRYTEPNLRP